MTTTDKIFIHKLEQLEQQRDELLAALRDILEDSCDLRLLVANKIEFGKRIANKARAVIARAEKG